MHGWKWAKTLFYSVMLGSLFIMVIFPPGWEIRLLLAVLVAGSGFACSRLTHRQTVLRSEEQQRQKQAEDERDFVRIMNHVRHNWMNELQILYGYIQLKKYDKLQCALEKIKAKAQQESWISRLGVSSLVAFLLSYRARNDTMELNIEMAEEIDLRELPLCADKVGAFIQQVIAAFERHADAGGAETNVLNLEFDVEEDGLLIDFMFRGLTDEAALQRAIGRILLESALDVKCELQEYEATKATVAIRAPFRGKSVEVD